MLTTDMKVKRTKTVKYLTEATECSLTEDPVSLSKSRRTTVADTEVHRRQTANQVALNRSGTSRHNDSLNSSTDFLAEVRRGQSRRGFVFRTVEYTAIRPRDGGFGLSIRGGHPHPAIIRSVAEDSPLFGLLLEEDQLTHMNGIDISNLSNQQLLELLASAPFESPTSFTVRRKETANGWYPFSPVDSRQD
jgi:hypothetical protein